MYNYLYDFTERVVKATRSGDFERQQVASELMQLIKEKPEDASVEMEQYLKFLLSVAKGEGFEKIFESLPQDLKDLFGRAIQKFKGADINAFITDITEKVINVIKNNDTVARKSVSHEIENLINEKPENGSEEVLKYLVFLKKIVSGETPEDDYKALDQTMKNIYDSCIQSTVQNDMMDFMNRITSLAFQSRKNETMRPQVKEQLNSLLQGPQQPPSDIAYFINTLIDVSQGIDVSAKVDAIAVELKEIYKHHADMQ